MSRRSELAALLVLGACLALGAAPGARGQEAPQDWRYSVSLGGSLLAPRMGGFNQAVEGGPGLATINQAAQLAGAPTSLRVNGFRPVELAWGGQATLLYEFDEDLRGGIVAGVDPALVSPAKSSSGPLSTGGTLFDGSLKIEAHAIQVGATFQKVFRFEEAPQLRLYAGGVATYGILSGKLSGSVTSRDANQNALAAASYSIPFLSKGWSGGGLGGAEWVAAPGVALFAESGYTAQVFRDVQEQNSKAGAVVNGAKRMSKGDGYDVALDLSGFYVRIGVRTALGSRGAD